MDRLLKKLLILYCFLTTVPVSAQMSEYDRNAPVGWGTVDEAITGSNDENPVTVTTLSELKKAFSGTDKKTIYIKGEIEFTSSASLNEVENKTLYGLPGSALVNKQDPVSTGKSGVLYINKCKNIILRNITFKSAGAYDMDGNDNLTLEGSTHIWVDHCDFQDGVDGNFDCVNGSDYVCVSWCRFRYLIAPWPDGPGGADDHRNCNLWGNSDSRTSDEGKLRTTFVNCWWDKGCKERMPRVRFGKVHIANCLYTSTGNNYCVGAGYKCNVYVEKCVFDNVKKPWKCYATSSGKTDYNITISDCVGQDDVQNSEGGGEYFIPSDYYELDTYDKDLVSDVVANPDNGAGATLLIREGGTPSAVNTIGSDATIVSTRYFTVSGMPLSSPQKGINIVHHKMSDGNIVVRKIRR